ncbi:MAG: SRPBCC domain-containing protein [Thermomicrobiales bacterium]
MSITRDASGRRSVAATVEVPGTPEEVWRAIATGPGITSWFVPTMVEEQVGGEVVASFGPGMDSHATITAWDPPHRFAAESRDDMGPDDPTIATEWTVTARDGGQCTVRVVHSWVTESDRWDDRFIEHTHGWRAVFRVLRLYLAHFAGQQGRMMQVMAIAAEPKASAWESFTRQLGISGASVGDRVTTAPGAPVLAGTVVWSGQPGDPQELLIRLEAPAPGIAVIIAHPMGEQVFLTTRCFFYGDNAAEVVSREAVVWQAWLRERFSLAGDACATSD